jgi:hypothetical protein
MAFNAAPKRSLYHPESQDLFTTPPSVIAPYDEASFQSASVLAEDQKDYAINGLPSNKRSVTEQDFSILLQASVSSSSEDVALSQTLVTMPPSGVAPSPYDGASFQSASVFAEGQNVYAINDLTYNKRSVTFFDEYIILHKYEKVDAEQREELWYTRDEYALISLRNLLTVDLLHAGCFEETEEQTFRGLEQCLTEDPEREFDTVKAVLGEQHRQTATGVVHAGRIAQASRATSQNNRQIARVLGLRDGQVVLGIKQPQPEEEPPAKVIELHLTASTAYSSPIQRKGVVQTKGGLLKRAMQKFTKKMRLRAKKEQVEPWSLDYNQSEESVLQRIVIQDRDYRYIDILPLLPSKVMVSDLW